MSGNEYEDIAAAWDWNLIPGTTTSYKSTPLSCSTTNQAGLEDFVGGVSGAEGDVGIAVMRYSNPLMTEEGWQKAWFFLQDDIQHVLINNITLPSNSSNSTVLSVLDQKRHDGTIYVEGGDWDGVQSLHENGTTTFDSPKALWHAGIGYLFDDVQDSTLIINVGDKQGDWSSIGTSTQPPYTVDLFTASLQHNTIAGAFAYTTYPGTEDIDDFYIKMRTSAVETVENDGHVSAVYDWVNDKAFVVFWDTEGGDVDFANGIRISAPAASVLIFDALSGELTVTDPTQKLTGLDVTLEWGDLDKVVSFELPSNGEAGKGVTQNVFSD